MGPSPFSRTSRQRQPGGEAPARAGAHARHAARSTGCWSKEAASPRRRRQQGRPAVSPGRRSRRPSRRSSRPRNRRDHRPSIGSRTPRSSSSRSEGRGMMRRLHARLRRSRRRTRWRFFPPVPVPVLLVAFALLQQLPRRSPSGHSTPAAAACRRRRRYPRGRRSQTTPPLYGSWYSLWTRHLRSPLLESRALH